MFFKLNHGEHWKFKPRKKKVGMKQRFSKSMRKWLKENIKDYVLIKDGPLSGILIKNEDDALLFKLTWYNRTKNTIISFMNDIILRK